MTRVKQIEKKKQIGKDTMDALCSFHKEIIFPRMFDKLTFDQVCEMEFEIEIFHGHPYLLSSQFWFSYPRHPSTCFEMKHKGSNALILGRIIPESFLEMIGRDSHFKIGWTQDVSQVSSNSYASTPIFLC